jgi:hypothetical protein
MIEGKIDMDPDDKALFDEMMMLRYKFHTTGSIQIESKDDMRSRGVKSPDSLDAAVYATADLNYLFNNPYGDVKPGDRVIMDPELEFKSQNFYGSWVW